jgi:RHS repeat-associated protein
VTGQIRRLATKLRNVFIAQLFTGQRFDAAAARLDYGARRYNSYLGRLISPDSIVPDPTSPQSLNRYSYGPNTGRAILSNISIPSAAWRHACQPTRVLLWIGLWNWP